MSDLNVTNLRTTNILGKTSGTAPNLLDGVVVSGVATASGVEASHIVVSGVATASGGFKIGISSAGEEITPGPITELNFVGAGNTFSVDGTRVDISISGSGGGVTSLDITSSLFI
jgi:hypothetical protein